MPELNPEQFKYHSAPREARDAIAKHGIDWTKAPGANAPRDPRDKTPQGNYLNHDLSGVREMLADGLDRTHDTYRVNVTGMKLHPDPNMPEEAVYSSKRIGPKRVRMIQPARES